MKNLYLITRKNSNSKSYKFLEKAAKERKIKVTPIHTDNFDFSEQIHLTNADGIYRISTDPKSILIEKFLASQNAISFYQNHLDCIKKLDNVIRYTLLHEKSGLPIIKTIYTISNNKKLLRKYVEKLGGFPIIIKATGGQHGVGVMKIDSPESLDSISDYLIKQNDDFIMREFIDYKEHARLIVLGNEVISSIEYKRLKNDFRSNVGTDLEIVDKTFNKEIEDVAVKAVSVLGYEFGGVDILIDNDGNFYIAEVNFPCYFPRAQEYTRVDISGKMLDYLIDKSKS